MRLPDIQSLALIRIEWRRGNGWDLGLSLSVLLHRHLIDEGASIGVGEAADPFEVGVPSRLFPFDVLGCSGKGGHVAWWSAGFFLK